MLPDIKVFIANTPTDMRKSFDGLSCLVKQYFKKDVFKGEFFVFLNKRADRVKILYWDRNGYCVWAKRLEKGVFKCPQVANKVIPMHSNELGLLLEGIDLTDKQRLTAI